MLAVTQSQGWAWFDIVEAGEKSRSGGGGNVNIGSGGANSIMDSGGGGKDDHSKKNNSSNNSNNNTDNNNRHLDPHTTICIVSGENIFGDECLTHRLVFPVTKH